MDSWLDLNTVNLLGRVDSRVDKDKLIKNIIQEYQLGKLITYNQIHEGFEDYNIKLKTTKGTFLLKLFSQYKSFRHIKDNINGLIEFHRADIATPQLYPNRQGNYLYKYEKEDIMALGCLMEFFKGKTFYNLKREPTLQEKLHIIREVAKINRVRYKPQGVYDVWVVQNLALEYVKKSNFVEKNVKKQIEKILVELKKVDYKKTTKGLIHGDIQKSNVLINKVGDIRIIDFSVMEYNAVSIDIATFIGLFCISPKMKLSEIRDLITKLIEEYEQINKLSSYDKAILPVLIQGTFAANALAASFEYYGKENKSKETKYWIDIGIQGMEITSSL